MSSANGFATVVADLLRQFGWSPDSIVDLGDLTAARGTEMFLPLWLRIMGARGSSQFNINLVGKILHTRE